MPRQRFSGVWPPLATLGLLCVAWWGVGQGEIINPLFLPRLDAVASVAAHLLGSGEFYLDVWYTVARALGGLILSILIGTPLGLLFGRVPKLYAYFEMPVDFLRSVPSSALFFLFILFFGIGDLSKIAVVIYGCALVMLVGGVYGAQATREKQDRIDVLRAMRATRRQTFLLCILPDAFPQIAAALRVSVSLALVLVIVTEMFLGAITGLGHRLYDYYLAYRMAEMYFTVIVLGLVGYGLNRAAVAVEEWIAFWAPVR